MFSIIVPYTPPLAEDRQKIFEWCFPRLEKQAKMFNCELILGETKGDYGLSPVVNKYVPLAKYDNILYVEADVALDDFTFLEFDYLMNEYKYPYLIPRTAGIRLGREDTNKLLAMPNNLEMKNFYYDPTKLRHDPYQFIGIGLCFGISKQGLIGINFFDNRFKRSSPEDQAMLLVLQTIYGDPIMIDYPAWHLYHDYSRDANEFEKYNLALFNEYTARYKNKEAMLKYIMER